MSVWSLQRFLPPVDQDSHHHEQEGGQGDRDGDHLYAGLPAAALLDNAPHLRRYIQALLELVGKLALVLGSQQSLCHEDAAKGKKCP